MVSLGVHCYNDNADVFYCGNGFIGIHKVDDGETKIKLPKKHKIHHLLGAEKSEFETDTIIVTGPKHSTNFYEIME